jgi:tetratricopeptide (TPR) repeat protein
MSGFDSARCLHVARLAMRLDRLGRDETWFDPFAYSGAWSPPFWSLETIGATPRCEAGPLALPEEAWCAEPLLLDERGELERVIGDRGITGLALPSINDDTMERIAAMGLRTLVVGRGRLSARGLDRLGSMSTLTHLVMHASPLDGVLSAAGRLKSLRFLAVAYGATDDGVRHLRGCASLRALDLQGGEVTDAGVAALADLPIDALDLGVGAGVKGEGLAGWRRLRDLSGSIAAEHAARLSSLQYLSLSNPRSEDFSGLAKLASLSSLGLSFAACPPLGMFAEMPALRRLCLSNVYLPRSIAPLGAATELRELMLPDGRIADEHLAPLASLVDLRAMDLKSSMLNGTGLAHLRGATKLSRLNLFNCIFVSEPGLAEVARLPALEELNLGSCVFPYEVEQTHGLTDGGLAALEWAPALRRIDASGNRISAGAVARLRATRPGCGVTASSMAPSEVVEAANRGTAAIDDERFEEAAEAFIHALKLDATFAPAHLGLAKLHARRGAFAEAVAACDRAVELDPDDEALSLRAWQRRRTGDWRGAVEDLTAALAVDPRRRELVMERAEARFDGGDHAGAIADYSTLIDECVNGRANAAVWRAAASGLLVNRGCARLETGDIAEALADFERAVGMLPTDANAWTNRADALLKLGRAAEALESASRAVELDPGYAEARRTRARALASLGRGDEARADLEECLRRDPGDDEAREMLEGM